MTPRWIWLAVVPWVVSVSTGQWDGNYPLKRLKYGNMEIFAMAENGKNDTGWLDDMAEAFNAAHERRTRPPFTMKDLEVIDGDLTFEFCGKQPRER